MLEKVEKVAKTEDGLFIFSSRTFSLVTDVESHINSALRGSTPGFITAHKEADRRSEVTKLNVYQLKSYTISSESVPKDILELDTELAKLTGKEEHTKEELEEIESLQRRIKSYFERA